MVIVTLNSHITVGYTGFLKKLQLNIRSPLWMASGNGDGGSLYVRVVKKTRCGELNRRNDSLDQNQVSAQGNELERKSGHS